MATKAKKDDYAGIEITPIERGVVHANIIGSSPLILNRMSEKARQQIFLPEGRKTAAQKQSTLKHEPREEFRASAYRMPNGDAPTVLAVSCGMFKGAMRQAALDLPGSSRTQIGRLVTVVGEMTPLYGLPHLFMAVTRSADINKTPDIRTRCIVPEWACQITVEFTVPILNPTSIMNLLFAAGVQSGIGDWRQEKGSGNYGSFRICNATDPDYQRIMKIGRKQQAAAMENPIPYNEESATMLDWFDSEVSRRGFKKAA